MTNNKITYLTYDGILENITDSQVTSYIIKLSKTNKLRLISFEKKNLLDNKNHFNSTYKKLKDNNIEWKYFIYSKKPFMIGTLLNGLKIMYYFFFIMQNNNIYHCRSYLPTLFCYFLSKFKFVKYIFDMRGFWPDEKIERTKLSNNSLIYKFLKYIEIKLIHKASHIITLTNESKDFIVNKHNINKKKITVIPTCVDTNIFIPSKIKKDKKLNFCYLGSVDGAYDIKYVLNYFIKLLAIRSDISLNILTIETIKIKKILKEYNISNSNIFVKKINRINIIQEINKSDFGIFYLKNNFSLKASYPTKIGELFSCGIPIICNSFNKDISKSFNENQIGININFDNNDFNKFLDFIDYCDRNYQIVSNNCIKFAHTELSLQIAIKKINKIYSSI